MVALLRSLGGTAYVQAESAAELAAEGTARAVTDAPMIPLPVYAGVHVRNRHRSAHRRLLQMVRAHFAETYPPRRSHARG